jgi:hypothetical protein
MSNVALHVSQLCGWDKRGRIARENREGLRADSLPGIGQDYVHMTTWGTPIISNLGVRLNDHFDACKSLWTILTIC